MPFMADMYVGSKEKVNCFICDGKPITLQRYYLIGEPERYVDHVERIRLMGTKLFRIGQYRPNADPKEDSLPVAFDAFELESTADGTGTYLFPDFGDTVGKIVYVCPVCAGPDTPAAAAELNKKLAKAFWDAVGQRFNEFLLALFCSGISSPNPQVVRRRFKRLPNDERVELLECFKAVMNDVKNINPHRVHEVVR